jgi:hypothetical protein
MAMPIAGRTTAMRFTVSRGIIAIVLQSVRRPQDRHEAGDRDKLAVLDDAAGIFFFSGGDQLRITSQIGDTRIEEKVRALYERGGVIAGTSAFQTSPRPAPRNPVDARRMRPRLADGDSFDLEKRLPRAGAR